MPEGVEKGIIQGMYLFKQSKKPQVQLLGSGAILREVIAAAELLKSDYGINADIWSVTSFNELRREGSDVERKNMLSPLKKPVKTFVETCLENHAGPIVAATDYIRNYAEQIRPFLNRSYTVLGTDGFGRSDTRAALRKFFEVDRFYIVIAALHTLAREGVVEMKLVAAAMKKYHIDLDKPNPTTV